LFELNITKASANTDLGKDRFGSKNRQAKANLFRFAVRSTYAARSAEGMELAREIIRSRYERKRWLLRNEPPRIVPLTLF
jgi:hypothetical protein